MITDFPLDFARFKKIGRPNATTDQVRDAWLEIVRGEPRVSDIRQLEGQIEAVQRTALVGFPDWITAQPVDLGNGQASICVFSRSKFGYRDMGVNQKRGLSWLAQLAAKLPPVG
jgi:uncharacterized protein (DUF1499 family)